MYDVNMNKRRDAESGYRSKDALSTALLVCFDILSAFAATWVAWAVTSKLLGLSYQLFVSSQFLALTVLITIANLYFFDLYYTSKDFRRFRQLMNLITAFLSLFLMLVTLTFLGKSMIFGRRFIIIYACLLFPLILISRAIFSVLHRTYLKKSAIIIGDTPVGRILLKLIAARGSRGSGQDINIVGYLAENRSDDNAYGTVSYLGPPDKAVEVLSRERAQMVIYALDRSGPASLNELLVHEKLKGMDLISAAGLYEAISGKISYENLGIDSIIEDCLRGQKFTQARIKFVFDVILSAVLLALALPVLAICAVCIKLDSGGPVLFVQERVGRFGKHFKIYKLRTMTERATSEKVKKSGWDDLDPDKEGRITRFGAFLRKAHLDELPQLFNVIIGDMHLVGPRPEMEMYVSRCEKSVPLYRLRLAVKPGITGWAQVSYTHTSTLSEYRRKLEYDLYYLKNMSFRLDLEILIRTLFLLLGYGGERWPGTDKDGTEISK